MSKLRLDYFLSFGCALSVGDVYSYVGSDTEFTVREYSVDDLNGAVNFNGAVFESLAPRNNEGAQPSYNAPVYISTSEGDQPHSEMPSLFEWEISESKYSIDTWKPDIEALIKMQDAQDSKQEAITDPQEIAKLVYTQAMKSINSKPECGMLCRIEYTKDTDEPFQLETVTYQFETDNQICVIDSHGFVLTIDKERFITYHAVETRSEMDIAKEKQISNYSKELSANGITVPLSKLKAMQDLGMLAEIVLEK